MKLGHLFAFLAGALLVTLLWWRTAQVWRQNLEDTQAASRVVQEINAIQSAEIVRLESEVTRYQAIVAVPDTIRIPAERDTVRVVADSAQLVALVDTLLREQAQLHQRIGRDSVKLRAYASLVAARDTQVVLLTLQRDSLSADRDRWQKQAEDAAKAHTPTLGLGRTLDCAIGAAAGALVGELVADKPLVTISAAGVGCVVNAVR